MQLLPRGIIANFLIDVIFTTSLNNRNNVGSSLRHHLILEIMLVGLKDDTRLLPSRKRPKQGTASSQLDSFFPPRTRFCPAHSNPSRLWAHPRSGRTLPLPAACLRHLRLYQLMCKSHSCFCTAGQNSLSLIMRGKTLYTLALWGALAMWSKTPPDLHCGA